MRRIVALLLVIILLASGCAFRERISEIKHSPQKYQGKQVHIKGKVVETLGIPFVQKGIYEIDDGTGKIWIVSQKRRPARGEKVAVKGKVQTGFSIGEHSFGVAIAEGDGE